MIQIFDSWGGNMAPKDWDKWSKPYITEIIKRVKAKYTDVPIVLYINGFIYLQMIFVIKLN